MSVKSLSDYTFYSRYSQYDKNKKRRETWHEAVERLFKMHRIKYAKEIEDNPELEQLIDFAEEQQKKKRVLAAQRSMQFAIDPILKHNMKIYNCLDRDTEFVTTDGVKSFYDYEDGDEIEVFGSSGNIQKAKVRCYGDDNLNEIIVKRVGASYKYNATKNHRWLLKDGSITESLKVGDYILSAKDTFSNFDFDKAEWDEKLYWCYGMVFGDGTVTKVDGEPRGSLIRLCGYDKKYNNRFEEMGFKSSSPHSIGDDTYFYTGKYFKTTPNPEVDDPRLIKAFVRGYLDADGGKDNNCQKANKFNSIVATGEDHYMFIRKCFPIAGVYIVSEKDITGQKTNKGVRGDCRLFRIRNAFDRDNKYGEPFRVVSIKECVKRDTVWCLEVENDQSFTLPNGMITGNCSTVHINRERVFQEIMYVLLCGCGVGFSVQKHHIKQIGEFVSPKGAPIKYTVEDSIEGWADAIGVLIASWSTKTWDNFEQYQGFNIDFDFSKIRPEGSLIAGRYKAPGHKGLETTIQKIDLLFKKLAGYKITKLNAGQLAIEKPQTIKKFKLNPIDAYDIIMHISDAVLSGGVRRSATICMFSHDDEEMMNAKTGKWYVENPQRARSNNSAVLLKGNVTKEQFSRLIKSTKEYGEPGFIWVDDLEIVFNPCSEIGMIPTTKNGRSGWQTCNLTEINGKFCDSEENFLQACEASAIIGTLQAGYTDFKYLTPEAKEIIEEEALLGCSITGWMDNPDILFDPELQRRGAEKILEVNERVANLIDIKTAARATCVKPAGSTSCVLGTASGIHPHHARRYIRRAQVNKMEFCGKVFEEKNPLAVEESVWSANKTDNVISFLCEVPAGAITKNQVGAIDLLEKVKTTQQNWVEYGTRVDRCVHPKLRHNVSNTINVKDDEWGDVEKFIYNNQQFFAGISLLGASGDLDYPQAPFSTVLTPNELVREYGDASVFASGLIVDGLAAFDNNLWEGCNAVLGLSNLEECGSEPDYPKQRNYKALAEYFELKEKYESCILKEDWVRRVKQFADRYFEGDVKKSTYCLKHVSLWKTWCDLKREYTDIDWTSFTEENEEYQDADKQAAAACSGGACEVSF